MVTRPSLTEGDRAQLVLVGSVAIAFIIVSLVVVFNTVLFTNNLAARGSVEKVEDASGFQQQVERELPELIRHVENGTDSNSDLAGNVDDNVTGAYSELLAESYADTSPKYADVEFNATSTVNGTRVVQEDIGAFDSADSDSAWDPVDDPRNISDFIIHIDTGPDYSGEVNHFNLTLGIEGGPEQDIILEMYTTGADELVVNQYQGTTLENSCTKDPSSGIATLNVMNGSVNGDDCINSLDQLTAPYSVSYDYADKIDGNYSFVVNGTGYDTRSDYNGRNNADDPYANNVVLEAGVDLYFESRTVTYESNQTVTVREGPQ